MSFDIRLPNITAQTESGKIEQIKSYLFQLTEQLKWALNSMESSGEKVLQQSSQSSSNSKGVAEKDTLATFNSVKALIIKSADIVEAYYEKFNEKFSGQYVAKSDFGTYTENTLQEIIKSPNGIEQFFTNIQEITGNVDKLDINNLVEVNALIKAGELDDKVYGIEIGQKNTINDVEVFKKYARFTSDRLSFYDNNEIEVAYISDLKLYITNAQIAETLTLGRFEFRFEDTNDLICRWV